MLLSVLLSLAALCCLSAESASNVLPVDSPTISRSHILLWALMMLTRFTLLKSFLLLTAPFLVLAAKIRPPPASRSWSRVLVPLQVTMCDGSVVQVYCDMSSHCCNSTAGRMRVAYVSMTDPQHQCPPGLRLAAPPATKRACEKKHGLLCVSYFFSTHGIPYSQVCGRVITYQDGTPDGFGPYFYCGQQLGYTQ